IVTLAIDAATGEVRWTNRRDGGGNAFDAGAALALSPDARTLFVGGTAVVGSATSSPRYALQALDAATGAERWFSSYASPASTGQSFGADLVVDERGDRVFVTGRSEAGPAERFDIATVAFEATDGALAWDARYAFPGHLDEGGSAIDYDPDTDRVYIAGWSGTFLPAQSRYVALGYDAGSGHEVWSARYGMRTDDAVRLTDEDRAAAIAIDSASQRLYVAGTLGRRDSVGSTTVHRTFGTLAYAMPKAGRRALPDAGGWRSPNLEFVAHLATNNDAVGARIVGNLMYLTTSQHLKIYDISEPADPQLVGLLAIPAEEAPYLGEEDVDTNGKILLFGRKVVDVSDPKNPTLREGNLPANPHTWSCVLNCTWAYGSEGQIVNLANHTVLAGNWRTGKPATNNLHDVTEISPGLVVTSSNPFLLLDARENPANPRLVARGPSESRFNHGNLWPNGGTDRFLLVGGESTGPTANCSANGSAVLRTFDVSRWAEDGTIAQTGSYTVRNGLFTDGDAPADLFCAHWFDTHPTYRNGGVVAMAWYEHGTRLLRVSKEGRVREIGYYVPYGGSTSAAYWAGDDILYSVDYNRGVDILRYTGRG
ncbi:MAG TPA: PQQ-binding-like beta-propeller repeat protein, partial [Actinomycetota bacterium]|nr:PQQ-binding-like beta-propeller repeat protein [Actinomycetota bacterium]